MFKRSAASTPSAHMYAAASPLSRVTRPRYMARWSSSSASTIGSLRALKKCAGVRGFLEQDGKRRDAVVPLDKRRTRSEPSQRFLVERPHVVCDARTVIVDAHRLSVPELPNRVARQVNLADS